MKTIFIALANALVQKTSVNYPQYHNAFVLAFIITHRTIENHMPSALNLREQTDLNKCKATQSFMHFFIHTPGYLTSHSKVRKAIQGRKVSNQNKSTCSTSPQRHAPPNQRAINFLSFCFFGFFHVCFRCLQMDK